MRCKGPDLPSTYLYIKPAMLDLRSGYPRNLPPTSYNRPGRACIFGHHTTPATHASGTPQSCKHHMNDYYHVTPKVAQRLHHTSLNHLSAVVT